MNYFELFEIDQSFTLDLNVLRERYQALQRVTHPDRFATSSEHEKTLAVQKNALVSDGFHTLKNPLSRAEHLLQINGICLNHESQTLQDREFLFKQMELRESLSEVTLGESGEQILESVVKEIETLSGQFNHELREMLERSEWLDAADIIRKLKFFDKLTIEIERLEDELDDF